jgi:hypothetical protein
MLRLVHPAPAGQEGTRPPKGRRSPGFSLTTDERRHLAAALQNLRRAYGTWACLVEVTGVGIQALMRAAREKNPIGSPALALLAARAGGMSVEAVISGTLSAVGKCEACGSRLGHGMAARASGGAS